MSDAPVRGPVHDLLAVARIRREGEAMRATNIVRCAAVLLLGAEFMLLGTQVRAQSDTGKALPAHLANGQRVFLEYCAMCHGDGGQGDGEMAPQLLGRARVR